MNNPLFAIDFYKADHKSQYPVGTTKVYSNFTARSNKHANIKEVDGVTWFGIQYFIKDFIMEQWEEGFFSRHKDAVVSEYKVLMDNALGKDAIDVAHIEALHDLGYLPLQIKSLPEGAKVPFRVPMMTITNTLPEFFWLVNYIESVMSAYLWKPTVSATTARAYGQLLAEAEKETTGVNGFSAFQAHDFSFRGMSGLADATSSGAAHLLSSYGTDAVPAIPFLQKYYNADFKDGIIGVSVPATEHSVMCMGAKESETDTFRRLIKDVYPSGIVSIVSDTWDFWKVVTETLPKLKSTIMNRDGKLVIRPDSGDPVSIITGYELRDITEDMRSASKLTFVDPLEEAYSNGYDGVILEGSFYKFESRMQDNLTVVEISEEEAKGAVQLLWDLFGGTVTEQGYKVLDQHIGLIYGDSITYERAKTIISRLKERGFASTNVVLGVGSYTYQHVTRDTYGFAVKATYGEINGEPREIFKDPVTDSGLKKSLKGLVRVEMEDGKYVVYDQQTKEQEAQGELKTVFYDGILVNPTSLKEIRSRIGLVS